GCSLTLPTAFARPARRRRAGQTPAPRWRSFMPPISPRRRAAKSPCRCAVPSIFARSCAPPARPHALFPRRTPLADPADPFLFCRKTGATAHAAQPNRRRDGRWILPRNSPIMKRSCPGYADWGRACNKVSPDAAGSSEFGGERNCGVLGLYYVPPESLRRPAADRHRLQRHGAQHRPCGLPGTARPDLSAAAARGRGGDGAGRWRPRRDGLVSGPPADAGAEERSLGRLSHPAAYRLARPRLQLAAALGRRALPAYRALAPGSARALRAAPQPLLRRPDASGGIRARLLPGDPLCGGDGGRDRPALSGSGAPQHRTLP